MVAIIELIGCLWSEKSDIIDSQLDWETKQPEGLKFLTIHTGRRPDLV